MGATEQEKQQLIAFNFQLQAELDKNGAGVEELQSSLAATLDEHHINTKAAMGDLSQKLETALALGETNATLKLQVAQLESELEYTRKQSNATAEKLAEAIDAHYNAEVTL